jgi:hypothetical protein
MSAIIEPYKMPAPAEPKPREEEGSTVAEILEIVTSKEAKRPKEELIAEAIANDLKKRGKFYFPEGERCFKAAFFFDKRTRVLYNVDSDVFKERIASTYKVNRAHTFFKFAWTKIQDLSIGAESEAITPETFWASRNGAFYLSNAPGTMVRIRADGIAEVDNGTDGVLFRSGSTLKPWKYGAESRDPFEICELFSGLSATAGHGALLAKLWWISLPTNPPKKPPICLVGTVGSGKTRHAIGGFELYGIDPASRIISVAEDGEKNFWVALNGGGIVTLDNADSRTKWLPDAMAGASTGSANVARKLYTDSDMVSCKPRSWIAITSAKPEAFAHDSGLADRLIIVRMERRTGPTKDDELSRQIADAREKGLRWICQTLHRALQITATPPHDLNARHPDWGGMAWKIGCAIGRQSETENALRSAESDKARFNVENNNIGRMILALVESTGHFSGNASQLHAKLQSTGILEDDSKMTARSIGKQITNPWPHLEAVVRARKDKDRTGTWIYTFGTPRPD